MNEVEALTKLIRELESAGQRDAAALAAALVARGVRLTSPERHPDHDERIAQMTTYATDLMAREGYSVTDAYVAATAEVKQAFEREFSHLLQQNPHFYLGMQTTGEMVRAVNAVPALQLAYGRMSPGSRAAWVSDLRNAWHDFTQAAGALGVSEA